MPRPTPACAAALLIAALSLPAFAKGGALCFDADGLPPDARWQPGDSVPLGDLGHLEVQALAAGAGQVHVVRPDVDAPALQAHDVALRLHPHAPVTRVTLTLARTEDAAGLPWVEVDGRRHELLEAGALEPSRLQLASAAGLHGVTLGGAGLRLDQLCIER